MAGDYLSGSKGFVPLGFQPYASHIDSGYAPRLSGVPRTVNNPVTPGYMYGAAIPLVGRIVGMVRYFAPLTIPVGRQIPLQQLSKPQIQGIAPNTAKAYTISGALASIPGTNPYTNYDVTQAYLQSLLR